MAMDFREVAGQPGQESLFGRLGLGNWAGQARRMGTGLVSLKYRRCAGQRGPALGCAGFRGALRRSGCMGGGALG
jgi:hypothetical protein